MVTNATLDDDVLDLMNALDAASAQYIIVGAHALGVHGIIRATSDFDLLVRADGDNAQRVYRALVDFGAPLEAHGVKPGYFSKAGRVYQMGLPPKRIDLITSLSGVDSDEAFETAVLLRVGDRLRPVLSLKTLLKNKKATGRPKDQLDVALLTKALKDRARPKPKERRPARARGKLK